MDALLLRRASMRCHSWFKSSILSRITWSREASQRVQKVSKLSRMASLRDWLPTRSAMHFYRARRIFDQFTWMYRVVSYTHTDRHHIHRHRRSAETRHPMDNYSTTWLFPTFPPPQYLFKLNIINNNNIYIKKLNYIFNFVKFLFLLIIIINQYLFKLDMIEIYLIKYKYKINNNMYEKLNCIFSFVQFNWNLTDYYYIYRLYLIRNILLYYIINVYQIITFIMGLLVSFNHNLTLIWDNPLE